MKFLSLLLLFFPCEEVSDSDAQNRGALFYKTMSVELCSVFRLSIPPFVPARTVLEGLESEDFLENEKPVKNELTDAKVKEHRPQKCCSHSITCSLPNASIA